MKSGCSTISARAVGSSDERRNFDGIDDDLIPNAATLPIVSIDIYSHLSRTSLDMLVVHCNAHPATCLRDLQNMRRLSFHSRVGIRSTAIARINGAL